MLAAGCCQICSLLIVCMHAHTLQIFIFMANDNNHSWAYATHNFEVASAEETLRSMRLLAGISSASASTEVRSLPCRQQHADASQPSLRLAAAALLTQADTASQSIVSAALTWALLPWS